MFVAIQLAGKAGSTQGRPWVLLLRLSFRAVYPSLAQWSALYLRSSASFYLRFHRTPVNRSYFPRERLTFIADPAGFRHYLRTLPAMPTTNHPESIQEDLNFIHPVQKLQITRFISAFIIRHTQHAQWDINVNYTQICNVLNYLHLKLYDI